MRVKFHLQVGQGEAINVDFARILFQGQSLYHDPSVEPYLYPAYPPLFPWIQSIAMGFITDPWLPGRCLAFGGYIGCGCLLFFWGKSRWGFWLSLLLSSLFCLFPTWALWGTMDRCDAFYLFLYFSAFMLLYQDSLQTDFGAAADKKQWGRIACAGLLTALALLTKQNGIELWLVYGLYCFLKKSFNHCFYFFLFSFLPVAVVFGFEQWQSDGFFLKEIFLWLNTGLSWDNFWDYILRGFLREGGILAALVSWLFVTKRLNSLLRIQVLISLLSLFSLTRAMSAENYFMEFFLFGIFLVGEGLAATGRETGLKSIEMTKTSWRSGAYFAILIVLFACLNYMRWPNLPPASVINMKYDCAYEIYNLPGEHLALDLDLPLMVGKKIWIQPAEYTAMVQKGVWSPVPLLRDIREKKFATIELYDIPRQYLFPQLVVDEINRDYHPISKKYGRVWLGPNP